MVLITVPVAVGYINDAEAYLLPTLDPDYSHDNFHHRWYFLIRLYLTPKALLPASRTHLCSWSCLNVKERYVDFRQSEPVLTPI